MFNFCWSHTTTAISPKPETRILHHSTEVLKVGTSTIMTSDHRGQRVNVANLSRLVEARHRQLFHRKGFGSSFKRFLGWVFFFCGWCNLCWFILYTYMYIPSIFSEGCCFLKSYKGMVYIYIYIIYIYIYT